MKAPIALVFLLAIASAVSAQSLGEIAKKADEQRISDKPKAVKVYTNKDLKPDPLSFPPTDSAPAPTSPVAPPSAPSTTPPSSTIPPPADYRQVSMKDEAYWKGRVRDAQSLLDSDQIHLAAMNGRVDSLSADFNGSRSISQRAVLRREREEAATEATRLRAAVVADRKAIVTIEEEARKIGVPTGWLRP